MMLMYLTKFNDANRFGSNHDMAWKGYDFDVINELDSEEFIRQGSRRSKSVAITEEGKKLAKELLDKYNVLDWK
ncbi:MAG: transposase [Tindallia sp. MSAO_Bac2]|nr:MAG: transposase [Tindallia sp. MSAO_Bac2]